MYSTLDVVRLLRDTHQTKHSIEDEHKGFVYLASRESRIYHKRSNLATCFRSHVYMIAINHSINPAGLTRCTSWGVS